MRERPPLFQTLLLLIRFTMRQIAWTRRSFVAILLLLVPSGLGLLIRTQAPPGAVEVYIRTVCPSLCLFLTVIVTLLFSGSVLRDAMDDRTLPFLLTRPIGRIRAVFGLYLGTAAYLIPLVAAAGVGAVLVGTLGLPAPEDENTPGSLKSFLVMGGTLATIPLLHGALFTLIGLWTRLSTVFGMLFVLLFEGGVGWLDGKPRMAAPSSFLESMLEPCFETRATFLRNAEAGGASLAVGVDAAVITIAVEALVLWVLIATIVRRTDFIAQSKPEASA